jgi:hypothetical protein
VTRGNQLAASIALAAPDQHDRLQLVALRGDLQGVDLVQLGAFPKLLGAGRIALLHQVAAGLPVGYPVFLRSRQTKPGASSTRGGVRSVIVLLRAGSGLIVIPLRLSNHAFTAGQ